MATLLLACTMVGAILTHVFVRREPPIVNVFPISLLLILTLVALEETRISAAPEMKIRWDEKVDPRSRMALSYQ
jgi:hypothetical protein